MHLITTPKGPQSNVGDVWRANAGVLIESDTIDRMLALIDQKAPQYRQAAREYLNSTEHRGYNCYVFKRELFDRMCQFQFPILFELEQHPSGSCSGPRGMWERFYSGYSSTISSTLRTGKSKSCSWSIPGYAARPGNM